MIEGSRRRDVERSKWLNLSDGTTDLSLMREFMFFVQQDDVFPRSMLLENHRCVGVFLFKLDRRDTTQVSRAATVVNWK